MDDTFQYEVFLSYGSEDKPAVRELAEWLKRGGRLVRRQDLMLGLAWVPLAPPVPGSIAIGSLGDDGRDDGSKAGLLASTGRASGTPKFSLDDALVWLRAFGSFAHQVVDIGVRGVVAMRYKVRRGPAANWPSRKRRSDSPDIRAGGFWRLPGRSG